MEQSCNFAGSVPHLFRAFPLIKDVGADEREWIGSRASSTGRRPTAKSKANLHSNRHFADLERENRVYECEELFLGAIRSMFLGNGLGRIVSMLNSMRRISWSSNRSGQRPFLLGSDL